MVHPPKELDPKIEAEMLGAEVRAALDAYRELDIVVYASEWEALNRELLEFFGEKSVSSFERRRTGITLREDITSGEIRLFKGRELVTLQAPGLREIGETIKKHLKLR